MHLILLVSLLAVAAAMPSYIAVPADQIAFVDLTALRARRVPRQTLSPPPLPNLYGQEYQPVPLQQYQHDPSGLTPPDEQAPPAPVRLVRLQQPDIAGSASYGAAPQLAQAQRPPDFGEYVDFGAHTGDNGAFGWYADFPVNNQEDHSGYRK